MEIVIKVGLGIFLGLTLWSIRDPLKDGFVTTAVVLGIFACLFFMYSWIKSALAVMHLRFFVVPKLSKFFSKKNLLNEQQSILLTSTLLKFHNDHEFSEILQLHRNILKWNKEGLETPEEDKRIQALASEMIDEYKTTMNGNFNFR